MLLNYFFFFNETKTSYNRKDVLNHFIDVLTCNVIFCEENPHIAVKRESYCGLPCSTAVAVRAQECQVYAFCLLASNKS